MRGGAEIGFAVFRGESSMMECLERHKIATLTPMTKAEGSNGVVVDVLLCGTAFVRRSDRTVRAANSECLDHRV